MSYLLRPDLNRVELDVDSFLGRAIALGGQYEKLPPRFLDGLMVYLRARGLEHAHRKRRGIRVERSGLETGIRQGMVCLDLALSEEAGGDLNAAVEILGRGEFERLRKRGWEIAFGRIEEMRRGAGWMAEQREAVFLQEFAAEARIWQSAVPETWIGVDGEGEPAAVDPQGDYEGYRQVRGRLDFLRSLPGEAMDELLTAEPGGGLFAALLRRLILAVALGRRSLVVDAGLARSFGEQGFTGGRMRRERREEVKGQIDGHMAGALKEEGIRGLVMAQIEAEMDALDGFPGGDWEEWFLLSARGEGQEGESALRTTEADAAAKRGAGMDMGELWDEGGFND